MSLDAKLLLTVYSIPRLSISGSNEQAALYDSEPLLVWINTKNLRRFITVKAHCSWHI